MTRHIPVGLALCLSLLFASTAEAQIKPRLVIAFDTSGSMALDLNGTPTFGDGVTTGCAGAGTNASPFCGANCTAGIDTDCDGETNDSRIHVAKEALRNMISAFGDVDWALARFSQDQAVNTSCPTINTLECNFFVTSYGNPQCNTGAVVSGANCGTNWANTIPAACRPGSGGRPSMRRFDGTPPPTPVSPTVCTNYDGVCSHGAPARGGDVLVGFSDLGPFAGLDNTLAIYSWLDGTESNFINTTTEGNYCNSSTTGDCELRPEGPTPLGGLLTASQSYIVPIRTADTASMCRPYSVILITDGAETCGGDPSGAAGTLLMNGISTYVIGLDISSAATRAQLNGIATAGGTDAGAPGGDTAFFADDPVTLSAGLAEIVADSLLVETCNGLDDDCDVLIDEGVLNACGGCGAVPAETCNTVDDDCDGTVDEGVSNLCGTCGPAPTEVCNLSDDDCDGTIDEGVCGGCVPSAELCDGMDNDCDMAVDEGVNRPCGTDVGECTVGTQTCVAPFTFGACSGVGPTAETCNNRDDDCDGVIDGMSRSCGSDVGACAAGTQRCTAGAYGTCTGAIGPTGEICDGIDNDCDGTDDEGNPGGGGGCGSSIGLCSPGTLMCTGGSLVCGGGTLPTAEACNGDDDDCDGVTDEGVPTMGACGSSTGECRQGVRTCVGGSFTCVGNIGPAAEVCDGRDNDCDGTDDEGNPGGGASCGSMTGICTRGTSQCVGGSLVCVGGTPPGAEVCNGDDDDCDGLVDESIPSMGPCGMSVGACMPGMLACTSGSFMCVGGTGPTPEICDGIDNNCDGTVDEGDPEGGAMCGDGTGECTPGTTACVSGSLMCVGGTGPTPEICDGLDNDCDGVPDEGLGVGAPCGSDVGECSPGVNICSAGALVCTGEIGPRMEECNLLDDDCDGAVDELSLGGPCGSDEGLCMTGSEQCIGGALICMGAVDPTTEACDCSDNDCDGATDEGGSLCPSGTACRDCGCADPCVMSEFGFTCPTGTTPSVEGTECYCVAPRCSDEECATETVTRDGADLCTPDSTDVSNCVCKNNECTFPCDGTVCAPGLRCNPRDPLGRCVEDSCRGLGCPMGEVCNRVTAECESDACDAVTCGSDEACRDGICEDSCADVTCADGEVCSAGVCSPDLCDGVTCLVTETCDESTGECIEDMCRSTTCPMGTVCNPATGNCDEDPCARLRCPGDEICVDGECAEMPVIPDAGPDTGGVDAGTDTSTPDDRTRVLATGGGGCTCSVPGAETASSGDSRTGALGLLFGLLGLGLYRRRRKNPLGRGATRALAITLTTVLALLLGGCDVEPYCLDCVDADAGAADTGRFDTGRRDTGPVDSGADVADSAVDTGPDGCVPGAPELCNLFDDDCDGTVDEGVDTTTDVNNCGGCGERCAPENAFPECVDSVCILGSCRTGYYDLDDDDTNGCEYRCSTLDPLADDSLCDLRDNDCDGTVDEDVDFTTDPLNCGTCGTVCRFARAMGDCSASACVLGDCDPGFYDIDGAMGNGCEYACTPASPAVETCNSVDDDCDGMVDEGDPGGGGTCGSAVGECTTGIEQCMGGTLVCMGAVEPTTEVCNGLDDDCDGTADQGNPEGGALCGPSLGVCVQGRQTCVAGALTCVGGVTATAEVCNGLDDDCDGTIDDGNPDGGGSCGSAVGDCMPGTFNCRGGVLLCEGRFDGSAESCDGDDNDCDGMVDEGNPGGGGSCMSDVGLCVAGTRVCMAGSLTCTGFVGPATEVCNGLDDNCDGTIDDGDPGGGGSCGSSVGACTSGTQTCAGGALQCIGGMGPTLELCNGINDDCDLATDEGFDLMNDVRHCGGCGMMCMLNNATPGCSGGSCVILACDDGFVDLDTNPMNGCEYPCSIAGAEVCNGVDDDCDGLVDNGISPPPLFCNPNGECSGTSATCSGAGGWVCNYTDPDYESTEVSCDGLDNDCDGAVDEPFPLVGQPCANGAGICRRTGTIVCSGGGTTASCNAPPAGMPLANELCNQADDDCDGTIDEAIPVSAMPTVDIGGGVRIMQYEASRPDATSTSAGFVATRACSNPNTLPWTDLSWSEARAACLALNNGGVTGWRLCDESDWESACQGPGGTCTWSYDPVCTASSPTRCNGKEYDSSGAAGDQDALFPTASATFANCFTDWAAAGVVYDMSGNVKEWTNTAVSPGIHAIRGGSYNNIEPGRTCTFDFTVGDNNFSFPNTGFRCCNY